MSEKFTQDYYLGKVFFEEEDIANEESIWEKIIGDDLWSQLECPHDKIARYLTMINNLWYEHTEEYVEVIAGLSVRITFIYSLLYISRNYDEETVIDMKTFFEHFIEYLNNNVDMIERLSKNEPEGMVSMRIAKSFSEYIGRVIENSNEDERRSDKES